MPVLYHNGVVINNCARSKRGGSVTYTKADRLEIVDGMLPANPAPFTDSKLMMQQGTMSNWSELLGQDIKLLNVRSSDVGSVLAAQCALT